MDLRRLRYFVAVAEERQITRAAARLGIAQPPLSQQIRALEVELGATLLVRLPGGVALTPAGEALLADSRAILAAADRAAARARLVAAGHRAELRLGLTTSAATHGRVPRLLCALAARHPGLALDVHEGNAAELTEWLLAGRVQAALMRGPVARPPGLEFASLLREPLLLALPAGHALASRRAVALPDLAGEGFILVRRHAAPGLYADAVAACRRAGFEPVVRAEVGRMLTNLVLVAAGIGVSFVPASMRGVGLAGIAYRALLDTPLTAPLTLATRADETDPVVRDLRLLAREGAEPQPA